MAIWTIATSSFYSVVLKSKFSPFLHIWISSVSWGLFYLEIFSSTHLPLCKGQTFPFTPSPTALEHLGSSAVIQRMTKATSEEHTLEALLRDTHASQLSAGRGRKHEVAAAFRRCSCLRGSLGSCGDADLVQGVIRCSEWRSLPSPSLPASPCPIGLTLKFWGMRWQLVSEGANNHWLQMKWILK